MDINDAFPSKYLKATDLPKEGKDLTISKVTMEDPSNNNEQKKAVVHFEEVKPCVLNVTNKRKLVQLFGTTETDAWCGRRVTLYQAEVQFKGEEVPGIRIKSELPAGEAGSATDDLPV